MKLISTIFIYLRILLLFQCKKLELHQLSLRMDIHESTTKEFINFIANDPELKELLEKDLKKAKLINPDKLTNPAQSLEELYSFLDWSVKCLPWEVLKNLPYNSLYSKIDQATGYFWFIFDQPLDELKDKGFYYPTLHYLEPIASWEKKYAQKWGSFLSTEESWNDEYYNMVLNDEKFGLKKGWYGDKNIWNSFNEFFSRKLIDKKYRPIANSTVVSPADSVPQGIFKIDLNNKLIFKDDVILKSAKLDSIEQLIGEDSKYCKNFAGGTLTHTFLDIFDYHRYHFPVSGVIKEVRKISGANAGGGITEWDPKAKKYVYFNEMGFQMIETRDCVIVENDIYGLIAILPVGMSQICSCNFEDNVKVGNKVEKGDPMGYFLFGGSDIVMIFQNGIECEDLLKKNGGEYEHVLTGEAYFNLKKVKK